ncbi:MAG: TPM domain-containing protein [Calditrichaeota bacterium]|nr:TPM domain-containing protein [Calditrichota bacterium]RQV93117.1 MAG: TPM domain-containing protein [bacterium]RQW04327.1 MAG: TPM domain-containing protein [Calditrichota bacterium]
MAIERSSSPEKFFTDDEKSHIVKAIQEAEKKTSGEIRIHMEEKAGEDIYKRAIRIFEKIGMTRTVNRNGVLIYLATGSRQFVILGDKGINEVVSQNFWEDVVRLMTDFFKSGKFCEGVCEGIRLIGEKLKDHFPYQTDDINELSDDISISEK